MSIQQSIPGSSIAIVGMGQGGTSILKLLLQIPGARVKYVCDTNPATEGMLLGSKIGITCLTELKGSAVVTDRSLNLIFEATGKKDIFEYLQKEAATYCTVIGAVGARVIYYLLDGQQKITEELQQCKMILSEKVMERTEELEKSNLELQRQINEYQELNNKLHRINEEKTKYLVNATHQLKAPFAAVQSYTELLLDGYADTFSEKAESIIRKMKDRCILLSSSIKEMLELANLNSFLEENLQTDKENLDVILQKVIDSLQPLIKRKNMIVTFHSEDGPHIIQCNKQQIEALVQILLENAVNYSDLGMPIDVLVKMNKEGRVLFSVSDKGIGIDKKNLQNIFKEYFRTNRGVQKSYNGSGLGLAIAKRIAELHRSDISVDSIPGEGSVFKIEFPK